MKFEKLASILTKLYTKYCAWKKRSQRQRSSL